MTITRRTWLGASAATATAWALAGPGQAAAPAAGRQVASLYRHKVGDIEVTAVSDGSIALPPQVFGEANLAEARRLLAENFQPTEGPVPCALNGFLVNAGGRLSLLDTGSGDALGPTMGHMPANLATMGVTPDKIDSVVLTHMHRDHAGGLCDKDGRALFPTAELVIPEVEAAFWFDDSNIGKVPQGSRGGFAYAKQVEAAYRGRIRRIADGQQANPGITCMAAHGHTPGHSIYRIASGNAQLLVFGDMVHFPALQVPHPEWGIAFDVDPQAAVATRRRVFDMVVADRLLVAGMHMEFPGFGRMRRDANGYRLIAAAWQPAL